MFETIVWILLATALGVVSFQIGRKFPKNSISASEMTTPSNLATSVVAKQKTQTPAIPSTPSASGIPDYGSVIFGERQNEDQTKYHFFVSAGSQRGQSHRENGISRQDNFCVFKKGEYIVVAISDGVSSATEAQLGSTFLVQNFERLFDETFTSGPVAEMALWRDLNKRLSQNLVAMFISRAKRDKVSIPESIEDVRIEAAKKIAATMEVLICHVGLEAKPMEFFFVRLAGDGKLFAINNEVSEIEADGKADRSLKNQTVRALPIFDGEPLIYSGILNPSEAIALTTDGIGDVLLSNASWTAALKAIATADAPDERKLLDFLNHPDSNSRDDRTIVIVANRS